jgi:hypothetical protein
MVLATLLAVLLLALRSAAAARTRAGGLLGLAVSQYAAAGPAAVLVFAAWNLLPLAVKISSTTTTPGPFCRVTSGG